MIIPFNKPHLTGKETAYMQQACTEGHLSGNGPFTKRCHSAIEERIGCRRSFLTHSGTAALEMAAILADIRPGDEIIMPSYTFVSTANAFVLRGGVPVFVDIRPDTLNIDEGRIRDAITPRTKAIVPVHYAGVGCAMDEIMAIAREHGLLIIEDAAHGFLASYQGRQLGSIGHMAAFSFHETKNVISGEGGALAVNDERFLERAEIVWEKGTDRSRFDRGMVDKYTWIDIGSSFLPSELTAAFLCAQLEEAERITEQRLRIWHLYHEGLADAERKGQVRRPVIPDECRHNGHMYHLLSPSADGRTQVLARLKERGIEAVFHYIPLHDSPAGEKYGRPAGPLPHTGSISARLFRLPLWADIDNATAETVVQTMLDVFSKAQTS